MKTRIVGALVGAFLAVGVLPATAATEATAAEFSTCIDITVILSPRPSWSVGFPYDCDCGPALTQRPIPGGVEYTVNTGCIRQTPSGA